MSAASLPPLGNGASNALSPPREENFSQKLFALLEARYGDEGFGVDQVCRQLCLSHMQVYRKIKRETGRSPGQLLVEFRMAKAKHLLETTDLPICEVADRTGFGSHNNFSRTFRRLFQCPPARYRANSRPGQVINRLK